MKDLQDYSKEDINDAIDMTIAQFAAIKSISMKRMEKQIEYARKIIDVWHEGKENIILSAPTGFGKSIMAFFIAKTMRNLNSEHQSYLMTSNKFLQNQYNRDIVNFKFDEFSTLKGQSNYTCHKNNEPFTKRACSDKSISSVQSGMSEYKCFMDCKYIQARIAAMEATGTILNYNYWLTTMNYVFAVNPYSAFTPREVTIFDECHVMGNIVQDMFTIDFNPTLFIRRCYNHLTILRSRVFDDTKTNWYDFEPVVQFCEDILKNQDSPHEVINDIKNLLEVIIEIKNEYAELAVRLVRKLPKKDNGDPIKSPEDKKLISFVTNLMEIVQQLSDMVDIYINLGNETIVVQIEHSNDKSKLKPIPELNNRGTSTILLQCTSEKELVQKAVHSWTKYSLFMSATLGNIDDYAKQIGLEPNEYEAFEIPQVFSFDKSPIYTVEPMISMNFRNRAENTPIMLNRILKIMEHHPNERGLIHTGNFKLMKELESMNNSRIKTYSNSLEKEEILSLLNSQPNAIVCGPSLIEGVDLKNDLCRFMIFMKVPFLSLGDKLIKKKMTIYDNWYNWQTMTSWIQGLGRPIRNKEDYCTTYLLDESFQGFFGRYPPPKWIKERMKFMRGENIGEEFDPEEDFRKLLES